MQLIPYETKNALVLTVNSTRIDAASAIAFKDAFRAASLAGPGRIILDLGKVDFIDSSGLGAVVAAMKMLAPQRVLELAALTPNVTKVFQLTRMDSVFSIYPDLDSAQDETAA